MMHNGPCRGEVMNTAEMIIEEIKMRSRVIYDTTQLHLIGLEPPLSLIQTSICMLSAVQSSGVLPSGVYSPH